MRKFARLAVFSVFLTLLSFLYSDAPVVSDIQNFYNQTGFEQQVYNADGGHKLARDANGVLHAVFCDIEGNTYKLVYARKKVNDTTWSTKVLTSISGDDNHYVLYPSIAVDGSTVYIVYAESIGSLDDPYLRLMIISGTDLIDGSLTQTPIPDPLGYSQHFFHTDILVSNGYINITAVYDHRRQKIRFFRGTNINSMVEENSGSFFVPSNSDFAFAPYLASNSNGDVFLTFDLMPDTSHRRAVIYKRAAANNSWGAGPFANITPESTGDGLQVLNASILPAGSGELYVAYSRRVGGSMSLAYRRYDSYGQIIGNERNENLVTASMIFTPQLGMTTANVPVIQYVANTGSGGYRIWQLNKKSHAPTWSTPTSSVAVNNGVFLHTIPEIRNDRPDMLWFDHNNNTGVVYYNSAPDKIAPWQPDAPSLVWSNQNDFNTTDTQIVNATASQSPRADDQNYIRYIWSGAGTSTTGWTNTLANTQPTVADRQTVSLRVVERDAAGNESDQSLPISLYLADRTPPTGEFTIVNDVLYTDPVSGQRYTNTTNLTLSLTGISDPSPGASNVSGSFYVSGNSFSDVAGTTKLDRNSNPVSYTLTGADGLRTVFARFYDVSANYTVPNKQATVNVDLTPPTWFGTMKEIGPTETATFVHSWPSANDTLAGSIPVASGVNGYYVYWGPEETDVSSTEYTTGTSRSLACSAPGTYYLRIQPMDNVGNRGSWVTVLEYEYDGLPVYGSVYINETPNFTVKEKYTNTLNVDLLFEYGTLSGINILRVNFGNQITNLDGNQVLTSGASQPVVHSGWMLGGLPSEEGERKIYAVYSGEDTLNSNAPVSSSIIEDTIIYDITPPNVAEHIPRVEEGWTSVNNREVFTWSDVPDAGNPAINSGTAGYDVAWDTNPNATPSATGTYQTYSSFDPPVCPATDIYYLHVRAVDRAGNRGPWTIALVYKYDGDAPNGTVMINNNDPTVQNRNVQLTVSADDLPAPPTRSGMAVMQINETGILGNEWRAFTPGNIGYTLQSPGNGAKKVYIWYRDNAGNVSTRIDSNPIELREDLPDPGEYYGSIFINNDALVTSKNSATLILDYFSSDAPTGIQMKLYNELSASGSALWEPANNTYTWDLSSGDGIKYVYVEYKDSNGHIWGPYSDTIILDTTAPYERTVSGGILINSGAPYTTTLSVDLTLDAVGADEMLIWNQNDPQGNNWVPYNVGRAWLLRAPFTAEENRTVNVIFRDLAGNESPPYSDAIRLVNTNPPPHYPPVTPSISIAYGDTHSKEHIVDILINAPEAVTMSFSNNPNGPFSTGEPYDIIKEDWNLLPPDGDGKKTVYAVFEYPDGTRVTVDDFIIYDSTPPTGDPDDNPLPPGSEWDGSAAVRINDNSPYTPNQLVHLDLSAKDMQGNVEMLIGNDPDFSDATGWEPYRPTRDWTLTPGDGEKTVYVRFRDEAGNTVTATDKINLSSSMFGFRFIEPDGYHDVASSNFTVSWEDSYLGDPNAEIKLYFGRDKNSQPDLSDVITANPIPVSDQVNGIIWDTSDLETGKYYPYAVVTGIYGEVRVYSEYPVYVYQNDGNPPPTEDPHTDLDPPPTDTDENPPSILVLNPTLPDTLPNNGVFTVQYQYAYTQTVTPTLVSFWYDTGNDPRVSSSRVLITENIDAATLAATGVDIYNWGVSGVPNGTYYVYAEIKNGSYVRGDYSTGTVLINGNNHNPGNGGTGEPIWSFPNPFSPITRDEIANIAFNVDEDGWARIFIYNIRGERIWQTTSYAYAGKDNLVIWDGKHANGQTAGNGIYILILTNENHKVIGKGRLTLLD